MTRVPLFPTEKTLHNMEKGFFSFFLVFFFRCSAERGRLRENC